MKNLIVQWADRRLSEVLERELGNQHQFRTTVVAATAAIILSGNSNGGTANNTGKHRKPVKLESSEKLAKQKG